MGEKLAKGIQGKGNLSRKYNLCTVLEVRDRPMNLSLKNNSELLTITYEDGVLRNGAGNICKELF